MLVLKQICKEYTAGESKVAALRGIDIEFRKSEFVSVLGPSGCGKTTILRMIAGLESPTAGEIYFDDTCVYSDKKKINILRG